MGIGLAINYFQNTSKPHIVTDIELDEMVNAIHALEIDISNKFDASGGHKHTAVAGDAPKIDHVDLLNKGSLTHANLDGHTHNGVYGLRVSHLDLENKGTLTHAQIDTKFDLTTGHAHDGSAGQGKVVDHTDLTSIGTNTHAQLDTIVTDWDVHINAASPHSGHYKSGDSVSFSDVTVTGGWIDIHAGNGYLNFWHTTDGNIRIQRKLGDTRALQVIDLTGNTSLLEMKYTAFQQSTSEFPFDSTLKARTFERNASQTFILAWSGLAAHPLNYSKSITRLADEGATQNNETGAETFAIPINLPNGASVDQAIVYGSSSSENWVLYYKQHTGGTRQPIADNNINSSDVIISHTVNNDSYFYFFTVNLAASEWVYSTEVKVSSIIVGP